LPAAITNIFATGVSAKSDMPSWPFETLRTGFRVLGGARLGDQPDPFLEESVRTFYAPEVLDIAFSG
jgi:hypothetical protein